MTERSASFDPASIAEGDELVFDDGGPAPEAPPLPPKRVKTGRKAAAEAVAPETALFPDPEPAIEPAAELPATAASDALVAPPTPAPMPAWLLIAALGLSLLTSTIACVGLLVASRTIAHANDAREAAEAQTALLARLPDTFARLDHVIAQEQGALAALQQGRAAQPVSVGDLQRGLDGLRGAIAQQQPRRDQEIITVTKTGQAEISERLGGIADALDHLARKGAKPE